MTPELKAKWLEALRSGKYKQGQDRLCTIDKVTGAKSYCCLGVLADIINPNAWEHSSGRGAVWHRDGLEFYYDLWSIGSEIGLDEESQAFLMNLNDSGVNPFPRLAAEIEALLVENDE